MQREGHGAQQGLRVVEEGRANGTDRVVWFRLPSGLEVLALATENFYGGEWDLGPTWNYVVCADTPFLVDTGRFGMGDRLLGMMASAGFSPRDLKRIVLSHGHEDHDGGLVQVARSTGAEVRAHWIYERLIHTYEAEAPEHKASFPASCWRCFMPPSFTEKHCKTYHREREALEVHSLGEDLPSLGSGISVQHVPGHSPDALAICLGEEAVITGDTVLPEITPFPSLEETYGWVQKVLPLPQGDRVFGLAAYLRSLNRLHEISAPMKDPLTLPAHRFFNAGRWNFLDLGGRIREIVDHHRDRCADILEILGRGPKTSEEIAREHFPAGLLKGYGLHMAVNEIGSHAELLVRAGDALHLEDGRLAATGKAGFASLIRDLVPCLSRAWDAS